MKTLRNVIIGALVVAICVFIGRPEQDREDIYGEVAITDIAGASQQQMWALRSDARYKWVELRAKPGDEKKLLVVRHTLPKKEVQEDSHREKSSVLTTGTITAGSGLMLPSRPIIDSYDVGEVVETLTCFMITNSAVTQVLRAQIEVSEKMDQPELAEKGRRMVKAVEDQNAATAATLLKWKVKLAELNGDKP